MAPHLIERLLIVVATIAVAWVLYIALGCSIITVEGDGNKVTYNPAYNAVVEVEAIEQLGDTDARRQESEDDGVRAAH